MDAAPCSPRAYTLASRSKSSRTTGAVITEGSGCGMAAGSWGSCSPLSASLIPTCSFLGLHWSPRALRPAGVRWRTGKYFCLCLITPFRPAAAEVQPLRGAPGQGRTVGAKKQQVCTLQYSPGGGAQAMSSKYLGGQRLEKRLHRGVCHQQQTLYSKYEFCRDGQLAVS